MSHVAMLRDLAQETASVEIYHYLGASELPKKTKEPSIRVLIRRWLENHLAIILKEFLLVL